MSPLLSRLTSWRDPGSRDVARPPRGAGVEAVPRRESHQDEVQGRARDDEDTASSRSASSSRSPLSSRRTPGSRGRHGATANDASRNLVLQAAALVLSYPDEELISRLGIIEDALAGTPDADRFAPVLEHLRGPLADVQAFHVQEFDLSRRHALHLTYWTDGDTRRRGEVLASIKGVYRESGLVVDTRGELPDHLPIVLEFAVADPTRGAELLNRFRASLELIRLGLAADHLPHTGVMEAVCALLPGESPETRAEVQARFGEARPVEFVGLDSLGMLGDPGVRPDGSEGVRA